MLIFKVQRKEYYGKTQANLSIYAQLVVSKVDANPKYDVISTQVAALKEKSIAFDQALVVATASSGY